jgi:hypothetical protein
MARVRKSEPSPPTDLRVFVVQESGDGVSRRVFTDRSAAEAHRRELDRTVRTWANPFQSSGQLESLCSDASSFWRALDALGVRIPRRGEEWNVWWESVCSETTLEQRDALWDVFDQLHYYVVVEVRLDD